MSAQRDSDILASIQQLVTEEHELRSGDVPPDNARLAELEVQLDQCWDLLRQRRAAREFGSDPATAQVRSVGEVEGYRQ